jgi:stringent starvation protein B
MTPHLLVDAARPDAVLPSDFVKDGKIVLNIGPTAVRGLVLGNERVSFNARFGGVAMEVVVPTDAIMGIYARENGRGMLFPDEEPQAETTAAADGGPKPPKPPRDRPTLKVVK